jgi:hypothetical protein
MKLIRTAGMLIWLGALATASVGQENAPAPAAGQAPAPPPGAPAAGGDAPAKPAPPAGRDDEFVPTQELQADEEVTFPVDI